VKKIMNSNEKITAVIMAENHQVIFTSWSPIVEVLKS
jgi:hypothetical protein